MNTDQIRARMAELRAGLTLLAEVDGDLDETQRSDWTAFNTEYDELAETLGERTERAERYASLLAEAPAAPTATSNVVLVATGDGAEGVSQSRADFNVIVKQSEDEVYDRSGLNLDNEADSVRFRDKALKAIDMWRGSPEEYKANAARLVDGSDEEGTSRRIADHILSTGQPLYRQAFRTFIKGGPQALALLPAEQARVWAAVNEQFRAMNEGTVSAGQAVVPPMLDTSLILTNSGNTNSFRQISTVKSITTQTWKGLTSAGVTAEWTAEAAEKTDASPSFTNPSITPIFADAYVQASFEMVEDSDIATELPMLFADARDNLEATAFATGTGSTQPYGIVTELGLVTASRTSANTNGAFGAIDVFNLDNNLGDRWRQNASWVANKSIYNLVRQFAGGSSPQASSFWTDLGGGLPPQLIGYPAYQASAMKSSLSSATASSDDVLILGDFRRGYYIVDRIGSTVAFVPQVFGSNQRPTAQVGWMYYWRVSARAVVPGAFQMLRV